MSKNAPSLLWTANPAVIAFEAMDLARKAERGETPLSRGYVRPSPGVATRNTTLRRALIAVAALVAVSGLALSRLA